MIADGFPAGDYVAGTESLSMLHCSEMKPRQTVATMTPSCILQTHKDHGEERAH